jgi:hypothetical protein
LYEENVKNYPLFKQKYILQGVCYSERTLIVYYAQALIQSVDYVQTMGYHAQTLFAYNVKPFFTFQLMTTQQQLLTMLKIFPHFFQKKHFFNMAVPLKKLWLATMHKL